MSKSEIVEVEKDGDSVTFTFDIPEDCQRTVGDFRHEFVIAFKDKIGDVIITADRPDDYVVQHGETLNMFVEVADESKSVER